MGLSFISALMDFSYISFKDLSENIGGDGS